MLAPGTRLGVYEVIAPLGAGGMGEVYRARDTKLGRDVAIKVLPASLTSDPDRLARFKREAQVLASLNHPNIAAIYHVEDAAQAPAIVMELVDGETLADRIAGGPIPRDEALRIAKQIAEALEAAHEQSIIHRDLKPANIKVRDDGTVKVLDFGLAKLTESSTTSTTNPAALSMSPTITSPALVSAVGVLVGTAAYMSPEQAKGRPADRRSDLWSFGCVLYEMLTGRQAFHGDTVAEVIASILAREPDYTVLRGTSNARLIDVLKRLFQKDPKQRWQAVGDVRVELAQIVSGSNEVSNSFAGQSLWRRLAMYSSPALFLGIAVGAALSVVGRDTPNRVARVLVTPPPTAPLSISGAERDVAITPDGSRVIYVGNNGTELFVRGIDSLEPVSLYKGTPRGPFVSPDGRWVGFFDTVNVLKKVSMGGGPAVTITTVDGNSRGAAWVSDDVIVFATLTNATGLQQVSANGGPITVLTRPNRTQGELDHLWPEPLPGRRAVLFTILPASGGADRGEVAVLDLATGTQKVLVRGGTHGHYIEGGHLIYGVANTVRAVAFDLDALQVRGTPLPVIPDVTTTASASGGAIDTAVAADGSIVYVRGGTALPFQQTSIVWVDRQGHETVLPVHHRPFIYPRLSPDGGRLLLNATDEQIDLWLWDIKRLTLTRLTYTPGIDNYPVWSVDGHKVIFSSEREGARALFWQSADGTGQPERLTAGANQQNATAVSPDGREVIFTSLTERGDTDVMQVNVTGARMITPLVQTSFDERNAVVSPDGRWLAYEANDSGQLEIYVRPYPNVNAGKWQVSPGGGSRPLWSRRGDELFYVGPDGGVMRVGIEKGQEWRASAPSIVVKAGLRHRRRRVYWPVIRCVSRWQPIPNDQTNRRCESTTGADGADTALR
jgi:serine/threonine-protein kinase